VADHATVAQHDLAGAVTHGERHAGLDRPERVDVAADEARGQLVVERVALERHRPIVQGIREDVAGPEQQVLEERLAARRRADVEAAAERAVAHERDAAQLVGHARLAARERAAVDDRGPRRWRQDRHHGRSQSDRPECTCLHWTQHLDLLGRMRDHRS
jgi:hypothetical protein